MTKSIRENLMPARTKYIYSEILLHQSLRGTALTFMPNFEAFIMMTRSITLVLQKHMAHVEGFNAWYEEKRDFMKQDEVYKFFNNLRVDVAHLKPLEHPKTLKFTNKYNKISFPINYLIEITGKLAITKKFDLTNSEFTKSILDKYKKHLDKYVISGNEDIDLVYLSCSYMEKLLELLDECVQQFTDYKNLHELQNQSPKL